MTVVEHSFSQTEGDRRRPESQLHLPRHGVLRAGPRLAPRQHADSLLGVAGQVHHGPGSQGAQVQEQNFV